MGCFACGVHTVTHIFGKGFYGKHDDVGDLQQCLTVFEETPMYWGTFINELSMGDDRGLPYAQKAQYSGITGVPPPPLRFSQYASQARKKNIPQACTRGDVPFGVGVSFGGGGEPFGGGGGGVPVHHSKKSSKLMIGYVSMTWGTKLQLYLFLKFGRIWSWTWSLQLK